jgi:cyclopropane fatty-acyl-phospholipid synthase-like methyltransferase
VSKLRTLAAILLRAIRYPGPPKKELGDQEPPKTLSHDDIYDEDYFRFVEQTTAMSADVIASSIVDAFHPESLVDVGCGTGTLLERLRARGVRVRGLEVAEAALKLCNMRRLEVARFDVTLDQLPELFANADLVVSMEVGHQLPESTVDRYLDTLCQVAPVVVFSSGTPGQGDRKPINEQPHSYWIDKFAQRGYRFNLELTQEWRNDWKRQGTAPWFHNNVIVFQRAIAS